MGNSTGCYWCGSCDLWVRVPGWRCLPHPEHWRPKGRQTLDTARCRTVPEQVTISARRSALSTLADGAIGLAPRLTRRGAVTLVVLKTCTPTPPRLDVPALRQSGTHLREISPIICRHVRVTPTETRAAISTLRAVIGAPRRTRAAASAVACRWSLDPGREGRSRVTPTRWDLAGWAEYDYCASHSRCFWGLRLRLVCTLSGLPMAIRVGRRQGRRTRRPAGHARPDPNLVAAHPTQN